MRFRHLIPAVATTVALTFAATPAYAAQRDDPAQVAAYTTALPTWTLADIYDFQVLSGWVLVTQDTLADMYDWQVYEAGVEFDSTHDVAAWDRVAYCEERGDWTVVGRNYSGGLGFANSTWNAWGGQQYAPYAGQATRQQQILVADSHVDSIGQRGRIEATRSDCAGYGGW